MSETAATDLQLLARYTRDRAEGAFAELVRRHVNLVHSAALRHVRSPQLAEEVAQSAFSDLARDAHRLAPGTIVTAWLYQVTRRTAIDAVRREARRQLREQIATEMNAMNASSGTGVSPVWSDIEQHLDEAMSALDETDRAAVLLRYFENKSLREVGATLGTSDDAAQKRVSRAVERLREFFAKRGVTVSASGLAVVISANAVQAASVGLAVTISTATALAGTAATTSTLIAATTKTIAMTTLQKTLVTATGAVLAGAGLVVAWVATHRESGGLVTSPAGPIAQRELELGNQSGPRQTSVSPPDVYSIESISPPSSFVSIHVSSFNNHGQAVGSISGSNDVLHAFVWSHGELTDLGTLGGSKAVASSINDLGEITAIVLTNGERRILFLQTNGITDLGAIDEYAKLGWEGNTYYAPSVSVNNRSEVTGRLTTEDGNQRSFLFREGRISYFGLRGDGKTTDTRAMNNRGDIAGVTIPRNEGWGVFLWHDGKMTDLETLGGPRAGANAMNDHGTIVGWATPTGAPWHQAHAIVWENGALRDLNAADWKNSRATGINNSGEMIGWATASDNRTFAFLKRGESITDLDDLIPNDSGWRIVGASAINGRGQILAQARKRGQSVTVILTPPNLPPSQEATPAAVTHPAVILTSPERPTITTFALMPSGAFHLRFRGQPGVEYVIEASTNLTTWIVLGEASNQEGQLEFTDRDAAMFPMRFYRLAQP